jgi:hypothetical protein
MALGVKVFRGVFVLRIVAAPDVTASEAQPEVDPAVAGGEAFLATFGVRADVRRDRPQVRTG